MPNLRRTRFISASPSGTMSCPAIRIEPRSGFSRPINRRKSVVLPVPEPPMMTLISPRRNVMSIALSTGFESKDL
jgi:hypothetical protein